MTNIKSRVAAFCYDSTMLSRREKTQATIGTLSALVLAITLALATVTHGANSFRVLVFSKTLLYRHTSITNGVEMLQALGQKNGFGVDATEDSSVFSANNLTRYKAIIFLSTSGDVLNPEQQTAIKNYIENGGGFVGIHAAVAGKVATEGDWPWYTDLFCTEFDNHKAIERATVLIEDKSNASTAHLPSAWSRTDEWYNFVKTPRERAHVIATLDEKSFHGGTMGSDHPVVWCRTIGKGRLWYTALGHTEASYADPEFIQHVWGGIQIATGLKPSNFAAK